MSQLITAAPPPADDPLADDPFAIGWRDVCRTLPDGSTVWEQIPLTLEDALHPQEGDTILHNTVHDRDWLHIRNVAQGQVARDPTAFVVSDVKVLWEDGTHHSPDVTVIFGVDDPDKLRSQFDVAAEGQRPRLIVEIVSPTTRANDVDTKVEHYHRHRVPHYVIVDRKTRDARPTLVGYQWAPRKYVRQSPDDDGRLWLDAIGVYLGVRENRVVLTDGATGQELGDYDEVIGQLKAADARAADADARAADAETRAADAETRAAAERARADALEARLRQLEAQRDPPATP